MCCPRGHRGIAEAGVQMPWRWCSEALGAGLVSAGMALSMLVAMNGTVMSGARVPYAVARDGYFFSALAEVHPRFRTPSVAILCRPRWLSSFCCWGAAFRQFFSLAIFSEWCFT
jgi:APA family basic amino acid/polyamine antiporter